MKTIIYKCRNCGFILHVFKKAGQDYAGPPTPSVVIGWYGGVCPRCGSKLKPPSEKDVLISPHTGRNAREFFTVKTCRQSILRILVANSNQWFTAEQLHRITGCSLKTVYKVLSELLSERIVVNEVRGRGRGRRKYFKVKDVKSNVLLVYR